MKSNYSVDIIIPFRDRGDYDVVERVSWRGKYNLPENFNFLFVDYGSTHEVSLNIKSFCEKNGFLYKFCDTRDEPWNASKARNIGILASNADFLFFEDLDLVSDVDFYKKINIEVKNCLIDRRWDFFVIPVSYLKERALDKCEIPVSPNRYSEIISDLFESSRKFIDFHADASSYLMVSRDKCIEVGGYDEKYVGWGYEDSDFWLKLLTLSSLDKPRNFFKLDTRPYSQQVQWNGWRALFRVHADLMAQKGIYSFHVWHPIAEHRNNEQREINRKIFKNNTEKYFSDIGVMKPMPVNGRKTIFFDKNPHTWNNYIFSYFDDPFLYEGDWFGVLDFIKENKIEYAVFNNPYGDENRLNCYKKLKNNNIKCYVVERGALPWSIYIDEGGFCAESKTYASDNWINLSFNEDDILKTKQYISFVKRYGESLEPQKSKKNIHQLKCEIDQLSNERKKIVFVALQSASDTTTNFFCGNVGSYDNFINEIQKFIDISKDECFVIYKNHPLSLKKANFSGGLCVDDCHINDVLVVCDCVTLINSGVGVLSVFYEKPVYYFGETFYAVDGLNKNVTNALQLKKEIVSGFSYNSANAIKFIWFLRFKFYSFAKWERFERKYTNVANLSISKNINYEELRIFDKFEKKFASKKANNIKSTILFDRYRLDYYISNKDKNNKEIENLLKIKEANKKFIFKNRKLNKLFNDPKLFFKDAFNNFFK